MPPPVRWTLEQAARAASATLLRGDPATVVTGVAPLAEAGPQDVSFFTNSAYRKLLDTTRAAVVIVSEADAGLPALAGKAVLVSAVPYAAFARLAQAFAPEERPAPGIDPWARIDPSAIVDPSSHIGPFCVVGAESVIGPGVVLHEGVSVGSRVRIGADTVLHPRVVVRHGCRIGARCILHAGAVVGADGFGFAFDPEGEDGPQHRKIPQVGTVCIEDDVELGAGTCVDRATFGQTVVGAGTKIDNLVQIGHNVQVGPLSVIAAQTGIAGSARIGTGVAIGGQAGIAGHITVGDLSRIAGRSGVAGDVEPGSQLGGAPAVDVSLWRRCVAAYNRLPDLLKRVRVLEQKLEAAEAARSSRTAGEAS